MAGAQPAQLRPRFVWAHAGETPSTLPKCRECRIREGKGQLRPRAYFMGTDMNEPTPRQKQTVADLIVQVAVPVTANEASRLIGDLRREQTVFTRLIEKIIEADRAGDCGRLGRLLAEAKRRVRHGDWLPLLQQLGINARRAQRLMNKVKSSGALNRQ